jgi:hypothetical protein
VNINHNNNFNDSNIDQNSALRIINSSRSDDVDENNNQINIPDQNAELVLSQRVNNIELNGRLFSF